MFDFGKDLKRFVAEGVGGKPRDPRVLELLPTAAVAEQAMAEGAVAAQAARPWKAWRDVALIWTAHARRTGLASSLDHAGRAAKRALDAAPAGHAFALAQATAAEVLLARFDLRANAGALAEAEEAVEAGAHEPNSRKGQAAITAIHARLSARRALMDDDPAQVRAAAALLDQALHLDGRKGGDTDPWRSVRVTELRLERAELAVQAGLRWKDERLLDQAGRDLRDLIETLESHLLPVSRGRAVRRCALALSALAALAGRRDAMEQAVEMSAAARDLFDVEHSPLDTGAALSAQAETLLRWQAEAPVAELLRAADEMLTRAWSLAEGRSTALEVEVRLKTARVKTMLAAHCGDVVALSDQEARLRARLAQQAGRNRPLDWAVDQLSLAGVYEALDGLGCQPGRSWAAGYVRREALEVLREEGVGAGA